MHVISRKQLTDFIDEHPEAAEPLTIWYRRMKPASFESFSELRGVFSSADKYGKLTVFNVGGNKYRVIADIH